MAAKAELEKNLSVRNSMTLSQLKAAGYSNTEAQTIKWGFKDAFGGGNAKAFRAANGLIELPGGAGVGLAGGGTPEQEAARQLAEQRHFLDLQLEEQNRVATEQRTATETQTEKDRRLLEDQLQAQLDAITRSENQRRDAEAAQAAAAEAERQAVAQKAAERAAAQKAYSEGRTAQIDTATGAINTAYAPFNDEYYNNFAKEFTSYYQPDLERQYKDAQKNLTYKYADQGGINSSASAKEFADLLEKRRNKERDIASEGISAADTFRSNIDSQRMDLLRTVNDASVIGAEILPEDISDVNGQIAGISSRLAPYTELAKSNASKVKKPTLSSLGNAFPDYTSAGGAGGYSASSMINNSGLYQPKQGGSVRIIA